MVEHMKKGIIAIYFCRIHNIQTLRYKLRINYQPGIAVGFAKGGWAIIIEKSVDPAMRGQGPLPKHLTAKNS
jgi:hypothetical protein